MSQSDYIRFIKTAQVLKNNEYPPVLTPETYTSLQSYHLETTVNNTKHTFSRLLPTTKVDIFDIEQKVQGCPTIPFCRNTNARTNRKLNTFSLPMPMKRINKNETVTKCTFINGFVQKRVACTKKLCKCRVTNM